jgi:hypothetical protein
MWWASLWGSSNSRCNNSACSWECSPKSQSARKSTSRKLIGTFQRGKLPHYSLDLTYMWIISTVEMIRKWCRTWMKNVIEQRKRIMVKTSYKLESRHKLQRLTQQCWTCLSFVSINHCWQHPPLCEWQIPNPIMTVHDQNVPPPARSQVLSQNLNLVSRFFVGSILLISPWITWNKIFLWFAYPSDFFASIFTEGLEEKRTRYNLFCD